MRARRPQLSFVAPSLHRSIAPALHILRCGSWLCVGTLGRYALCMIRFQRVTPFFATRDIARTADFCTQLLGVQVETLHPPGRPTLAILERDPGPSGQEGISVIFDSSLWSDPPALTGQLRFDLSPGGVLDMYERL